ncbi:High-affinity branched-chain amino acid transport ATP-binding protein LivF [bacterium HR23]|nr:High-affinity branched-chain amino acid transport ATP-binding protein LivF [bacterium HR23]
MLQVQQVTVRIGGLTILRSLSLEVPAGKIVGLVGRNGAGKTTTFKSILGLVPVVAGQIRLDGADLLAFPPHERARVGIGYMPEDRRLIGPLTVRENLLLSWWAQGRQEVGERLEEVFRLLPEVAELAPRRASQLSGGQQKLVALARSLLNARRLLLLDEPLEGVSPALSARLAEAVRRFQEKERSLAILVAESDLKRMRLFTQDIYTIERGEVIQEG